MSSEYYSSGSGAGSPLGWQYLWMIVVQRHRLFLWCFVPIVLLTLLYVLVAHPVYESTAVVQVELKAQRALKPMDAESDADDLTSEDSLKTVEQNLQSYDIFVDVANDPKIAQDPDLLVGYNGKENPPSTMAVADWLQAHTKVALRHGTRLIDITVSHRVPAMAQKLAQATVDAFVQINDKTQTDSQQGTLKLLESESDEVKASLQKAEDSLQIYKDSLVLKHRIDDQQEVLDVLKDRYREKHPKMIQARMLLADLTQSFDDEFKRVSEDSKSEAAYWASHKNDLASFSDADRVATELKLVEARSDVLQKEVDTESVLYDNVLKQLRETDVSQYSAASEIQLVAPPVVPDKPARPKKLVVLLLGVAMGALVGAGAIFVAQTFDNTIQTPMEAETALGLPVLVTIPKLPSRKRVSGAPGPETTPPSPHPIPSKNRELAVTSDPGGACAEAFRSLRATINLLDVTAGQRTLMFTSALPGEGKTFVACNFALSLAQGGSKTLLIDTDLRRPAVQGRFHLENKVGLMEVLTQDLPLSQAVHAGIAENLHVLTSGSKCPNPAELLAGPRFKKFVAQTIPQYDRIVFDSSPVNLVSDSLLVAAYFDSVYLVVRAISTPLQAPQHALMLLRRAHKEPVGLILNAVPRDSDRLYRGYNTKDAEAYGQVYS